MTSKNTTASTARPVPFPDAPWGLGPMANADLRAIITAKFDGDPTPFYNPNGSVKKDRRIPRSALARVARTVAPPGPFKTPMTDWRTSRLVDSIEEWLESPDSTSSPVGQRKLTRPTLKTMYHEVVE